MLHKLLDKTRFPLKFLSDLNSPINKDLLLLLLDLALISVIVPGVLEKCLFAIGGHINQIGPANLVDENLATELLYFLIMEELDKGDNLIDNVLGEISLAPFDQLQAEAVLFLTGDVPLLAGDDDLGVDAGQGPGPFEKVRVLDAEFLVLYEKDVIQLVLHIYEVLYHLDRPPDGVLFSTQS